MKYRVNLIEGTELTNEKEEALEKSISEALNEIISLKGKLEELEKTLLEIKNFNEISETKFFDKIPEILSKANEITTNLTIIISKFDYLPNDIVYPINENLSKLKELLRAEVDKLKKKSESVQKTLLRETKTIMNNIDRVETFIHGISKSIESDFLIVDESKHEILKSNKLKRGRKYKIYYKKQDLLAMSENARIYLEFEPPVANFVSSTIIEMREEPRSIYLVAEVNLIKPVGRYEALMNIRKVRGMVKVLLNETVIDRYPIEIAGMDNYFLLAIGSILFAITPFLLDIFTLTLKSFVYVSITMFSLLIIVLSIADIIR